MIGQGWSCTWRGPESKERAEMRQVVIPAQAGWGGGGVRAVSEGNEGRFPHTC